jgi:hypothetical protein
MSSAASLRSFGRGDGDIRAHAVLFAYVALVAAVQDYHRLRPGEMFDGPECNETTTG